MTVTNSYFKKNSMISRFDNRKEISSIVFGVPFDSTHTYKTGTRFGPDAIRTAYNNIELFVPDFNIDLETIHVDDRGNLTQTLDAVTMLQLVEHVTQELITEKKQIIVLGGEHLITLGIFPNFPKSTGLIIFDAHYDLHDSYSNNKLNHATYLRRIVEQCGAENIVHVGARAFVKNELDFLKESNIMTVSDKDIRDGNGPKLIKDAASTFDDLYVSLDLDVVNPGEAPGVGNPEALGITSRELYDMIVSLRDKKIIAADVVEMCPPYDNGATASLAAKIISVIMAMNIKS